MENEIFVGQSFEAYLHQYSLVKEQQSTYNFNIETNKLKILEADAITQFVQFLGNATIVGHRINFDIEIINTALKKLNCGKLKNEAFDIEVMYRKWKEIIDDKEISIEEMEKVFKLKPLETISSIEEAYTIALLFLKLKNKLENRN